MSNLDVLEKALGKEERDIEKTSQPNSSLHLQDSLEKRVQANYLFNEGQEEDQIDRKSFNFNPEEIKSKIKKTKKHPLQNIWGLPLAKFSLEEILFYMLMFNKDIEHGLLQKMYELESNFAEMVCSALHNHWSDQKLVAMALTNIVSVTQIATNGVKRSLLDTKIILTAIITASLQRDYLKYTSEVDDTMENVLLILYYGTEKDPGKPVRFDSGMIEAIMMLVPYVCHHLKRRDSIEEFFWLLRHLLVTMHSEYDIASRKIVNGWLSNHGIVTFVLEFMVKYSFKNSLKLDLDFMRAVDIAFLLKEETELGDIYRIVPNLLHFLTLKDVHPLRNEIAVDYNQTANIVILMFQYIVQNLTIDGALFLMDSHFLNKMVDSLVVNRYYQKVTDGIALICSQLVANIVSLTIDESESQKDRETCISTLKRFCEQLEVLITPTCDLKITCSYLFYLAATLLQKCKTTALSIPEDTTILVMMKALTVVCDITHVRETESDDSHNEFASTDKRESYLKHFIAFINCIAYYNEGQNIRLKLSNIVKDDLPEVISHFVGMQKDIYPDFVEAITRLVLLFFDSVEDFFSHRWQNVHYLMLSYYVTVKVSREEKIQPTKLLFMWRLLNMSKSEAIVSSVLQLEVDLRECVNESLVNEVIERCRARIKSKAVEISAVEDNSQKYFRYLITDLKSVLMDPSMINYPGRMDSSINCELRGVTYLMFKMAQNCKDKSHVKLLKSLVFWALDLVRDQNDCQIETNVNKFIIHLYLKSE